MGGQFFRKGASVINVSKELCSLVKCGKMEDSIKTSTRKLVNGYEMEKTNDFLGIKNI